MKFGELLDIVGNRPVFSSALLRVGDIDPVDMASQLSRWVASGKLISLRRGVYALPPRYARRKPHPFEVANLLRRPSYVTAESALSFHGMLPEAVFTTTSVTTARAEELSTALGTYAYRHIANTLFWGYREETVGSEQATAFVATPEKAFLDLVYLRSGADDPAFLRQLRLDRADAMDADRLGEFARRTGKPKLIRAADALSEILWAASAEEWRDL